MFHEKIRTIVLTTIGLGVWLLSIQYGMSDSCYAYYKTPFSPDFIKYIPNYESSTQSKFAYLFSPTIIAVFSGIVLVAVKSKWLEKQERLHLDLYSDFCFRVIMICVLGWSLYVATSIRADNAIYAAERLHWNSSPAPRSFVDISCAPFVSGNSDHKKNW